MKIADLKPALVILFLFALASCSKGGLQYDQILGSWKMKNVINNTGQDLSEKTTYYKDGTVVTEMALDGKLTEQFKSKYSIDKEKGILLLQLQKDTVEFAIVKLDRDEFDLKDPKTGRVIQNIRY